MTKNIGILTMYGNFNYGNRLQNYALSRVLEMSGAAVVTLRGEYTQGSSLRADLKEWKQACKANNLRTFVRFKAFTDRYIRPRTITLARKDRLPDFVFIGSDQVWNPSWGIGSRTDGIQCLVGVDASRKASYAASFGIGLEAMPDKWVKRYAEWLKTFRPEFISVREHEAVRIVENLAGFTPTLVLDPTMLLDSTDWATIERRPRRVQQRQSFCAKYVIGNETLVQDAERAIKNAGLEIIDLADKHLCLGPKEFLWMIHHSDLVLTDSFHGTVFSILFERPFIMLKSQHRGECDMSSRFDTLTKLFHIEKNSYCDTHNYVENILSMKWESINRALEKSRKHSSDFIARVFESANLCIL